MKQETTAQVLELDKDYILSKSSPVYPQCGIYFLILDDEIVYIGQSIHIPNRLKDHRRGSKIFNRVFFVECDHAVLDELEKYYIRLFAPALNKRLKAQAVKKERVRINKAEIKMAKHLEREAAKVAKAAEREAYIQALEERVDAYMKANKSRVSKIISTMENGKDK